jgi:hypothetical protein
VAVGNALISGGVGSAPSYGKIGLATHVSGTLPVANGGTGVTSSTGTGSVVLSDSPTLVAPVLGTPSSGTLTNCTFPTLNQNTTGSAATLTTGRTIAITGDLAYTSPSFNGSGNVTAAGTLATVNSNVGSFTNASITVNAKGLITAASSGASGTVIPSGTVMLFVQTTAPTGFTKSTAHDNKALRVVSGTAGSGGSAAFTTAFATPSVTGTVSVSGTVGSTTLTTAQIPSHTHSIMGSTSTGTTRGSKEGSSRNIQGGDSTANRGYQQTAPNGGENYLQLTGSSTGHDHTFSGSGSLSSATSAINVAYVDVIIATKN